MQGSLMQLAAFGLQDFFLVEEPQMTYWKNLYFQHTNFTIESIQHSFTGNQNFSNLISCTIPKDNGDLMGRTYISANISNINATVNSSSWEWANKISNPSNFNDIYSQSIKISPDNTYAIITGFFSGEIVFNNTTIGDSTKSSIFVVKTDINTGELLWIKTATNNNNIDTGMNFMDVFIMDDNSILLTGYFHDLINFDGTILNSSSFPNNYNSFIVKLSSDGSVWSNIIHIESTNNCVSKNIFYLNNIYIAGDFSLDLTINGTSIVCNEKRNGFICCIDILTSDITWINKISGQSNNNNSLVNISTITNNDDKIIITGTFNIEVNYGINSLTSHGRTDIFIININLDGTFNWINQIGGDLNEFTSTGFNYNSRSVKILNNDIIIIGVFFSNIVEFGNTLTINGDGNKNTFIAQLSLSNTWNWAISIDNPENCINTCPSSIFANNDKILVTGSFGNQTYNIGNTTLTNYDNTGDTNTSDTYIINIDINGNILWALSIGGSNTDFPANIDISNDGTYAIVLGYFNSLAMYIGDYTLRNTSALTNTYIAKLNFTSIKRINRVGFQLLNYVELRIGGKTIDKHYSNWMYIWSELSHNTDMKQLLDKMVGNKNDNSSSYTLNIPLFFSYCRHYSLAIPLISLKHHDVEIYVNLENKYNIFGSGSTATLDNISLWIDYYFLDTKERQEFAEQSHDYLIETVQSQEEYIISNDTNLVKLDFNHPIKFLTWVIKTTEGNLSNMFDYTDNNLSCFIEGQLFINNRERFEMKPFNYFNYIQPYQHFRVLPQLGINVYSFSLEPSKIEPSGSCNFSMIDKPDFNIRTSANGTKLYMYALNYNVLKIQDGMGGLVFNK